MSRYLRFNAVGVAGFLLQLAVVATLIHVLGMWYLPASVIAVEAAVLHNFVWHERWTWRDRRRTGAVHARLLQFHAVNGLTSVAAHTIGMPLLVGAAGVPPLAATVLLVVLLSVVNYRLADRVVFMRMRTGITKTPSAAE
jgi:putative flippase GtrA